MSIDLYTFKIIINKGENLKEEDVQYIINNDIRINNDLNYFLYETIKLYSYSPKLYNKLINFLIEKGASPMILK